MSELHSGKCGWMPADEYTEMKEQLEKALKKVKEHDSIVEALKQSFVRKSDFLSRTLQDEKNAQKLADEAQKKADRY